MRGSMVGKPSQWEKTPKESPGFLRIAVNLNPRIMGSENRVLTGFCFSVATELRLSIALG